MKVSSLAHIHVGLVICNTRSGAFAPPPIIVSRSRCTNSCPARLIIPAARCNGPARSFLPIH
jgi:hypothetical protein